MTNLSKWAELYDYYKETNRGGLVKSLYKNQPFGKAWPYLITLLIYTVITITILWLTSKSALYLLLSFPQVFAIYFWLNFLIENRYRDYYSKNNLNSHPYFQRTNLLSYILFSEYLCKSKNINKEDVELLIDWENTRNTAYSSVSFFNAPPIIIMLTSTTGLLLEYLKIEKYINSKFVILIIVAVVLSIWFSWAIFDTFKSNFKRNLEICRFLKWWKIEKDT
jgi:hypothetical protein